MLRGKENKIEADGKGVATTTLAHNNRVEYTEYFSE
jgi:hypothetical protein